MKILVLNAGSSSQKCSLFELDRGAAPSVPAALWQGAVDWIGARARVSVTGSAKTFEKTLNSASRESALQELLAQLWSGPAAVVSTESEIQMIGHRVVHGGRDFFRPTRITPGVIRKLRALEPLAPLHNREEVAGIRVAQSIFGDIPQAAVFDTAFHHDLPLAAAIYPVPYAWFERGVRRYGFHGIKIGRASCRERV